MAGGDPDRLTLRRFVDVAFAVLVGEYQRLGVDLITAIEKVGALGSDPEDEVPEAKKIDNKESINQLMAQLSGVRGAPVG